MGEQEMYPVARGATGEKGRIMQTQGRVNLVKCPDRIGEITRFVI
jgi:hypothetical protein